MLRLTRSHALRALMSCLAGATFAGCGGGDGGTEPNIPPTTGSLVISTSGLPSSLSPTFTLTTADGSSRAVLQGDTIRNLAPGVATLTPAQPSAPGVGRWVPFSETASVTIVTGVVSAVTVQYAAAAIVLTASTSGLPASATALVRLTAPDGNIYSATAGVPFIASLPGVWTAQGQSLLASEFGWVPTGGTISQAVVPGDTAYFALPYAVSSGAIQIEATGLVAGVQPTFTVTRGATSFSRIGPGTIPDLGAGVWTITSSALSVSGFRYAPAVSPLSVTVTPGVLATASVAYTATPIVANFSVEGAYLTQAIQTFDGTTPLVAGREALLRVFLKATDSNVWRPVVRATLSANGNVLETFTLTSGSTFVDTTITEGSLLRSWNRRIDASLLVPGLQLLIEADPDGLIAEDGDASDNIWPRNGTPRAISVQAVPVWNAVLVPVIALPTNVPGNVTEANKASFTTLVRRLLPLNEVNVSVRAPYTASVASLQSSDGNSAWTALLSEMNALRVAEGQPGEYWYGVVNVDYTSGVAGYGFVPGRTAIGWDRLPSGDGVAAHEWGHNFGRQHAPCGNAGNPDGQYPYSGGVIGTYGWNPATNTVVFPSATDLMGYCGNQWISAYNWTRTLNYRSTTPNAMVLPTQAALASAGATDRLLVWGTIANGRVAVEPAFVLAGGGEREAPLPGEAQTLRVDALDAAGRVLASALTSASAIDHSATDERSFAVTVPLTPEQQIALASVRVQDLRQPLTSGRRTRSAAAVAAAATRAAAGATSTDASAVGATVRATRSRANQLRLEWDATQFPRAMVRDVRTGRILAFPRESGAAVAWSRGDVEVIVSDGVRSYTQRITP